MHSNSNLNVIEFKCLIISQAYQKAVENNPTQLTGWQGLTKLYEKVLNDGKTNESLENKDRKWSLHDVANAYINILLISSQNMDIEKYVNT